VQQVSPTQCASAYQLSPVLTGGAFLLGAAGGAGRARIREEQQMKTTVLAIVLTLAVTESPAADEPAAPLDPYAAVADAPAIVQAQQLQEAPVGTWQITISQGAAWVINTSTGNARVCFIAATDVRGIFCTDWLNV
jgi:hypothetical protein